MHCDPLILAAQRHSTRFLVLLYTAGQLGWAKLIYSQGIDSAFQNITGLSLGMHIYCTSSVGHI